MIEAAGKRATPERPLAWLAMESDGDTTGLHIAWEILPCHRMLNQMQVLLRRGRQARAEPVNGRPRGQSAPS